MSGSLDDPDPIAILQTREYILDMLVELARMASDNGDRATCASLKAVWSAIANEELIPKVH